MIPVQRNNKLISSVNNTTAFTMETSAETFEIFSNQIYEHKIRAIIRELSCNANDSHVDAGKRDVPFKIHFPTAFEPYFEVEDFGVGLDDYDIRGELKHLYDADGNVVSSRMEGGIYTRYFASTKRESNESIGHLGLGSKSPMAYTKSMTVTARKDGVERHYVCYIGEDGQPHTTFNSEVETDKCNGVAIRFSVSPNDFDEFRREAAFVLSLFRVQPETNIPIEPLLKQKEREELNERGILILDDSHPFVCHERACIYPNMGGVVYPVRTVDYYYLSEPVLTNEDEYNTGEAEEATYYEFDKKAVKFLRNIQSRGSKSIIVNFPIGSLSFMPSREGLSQDPKTKFSLYKVLIESLKKSVDELQSFINTARQPLEAVMLYSKFDHPWSIHANDYYYNGRSINDIINMHPSRYIDSEGIVCRSKDVRSAWNTDYIVRNNKINEMNLFSYYEFLSNSPKGIDCFYINSEEEIKGLHKAIRFYVLQQDIDKRVFFFTKPKETKVFKQFKDIFYGNINYRHISELVEEVKAIDPKFFEKKKRSVSGGNTRTTKKNETKAIIFSRKKSLNPYEKRNSHIGYKKSLSKVIVNLDLLNPNTTAYVERLSMDKSRYTIDYIHDGSVNYASVNETSLIEMMAYLGITTCIVADGVNIGRIRKSNVRSINNFIKDFISDNFDVIKPAIACSCAGIDPDEHYSKSDMISKIKSEFGYSYRDDLDFIYDNDSEYTKPYMDKIIEFGINVYNQQDTSNVEKYLNIKNKITKFYNYNRMLEVYSDIKELRNEIQKNLESFRNTKEQFAKDIKSRYPLIFGVDEDQNAVLEYINMVNSNDNKKVNIVVNDLVA